MIRPNCPARWCRLLPVIALAALLAAPVCAQDSRFTTDRPTPRLLPLPEEKEAFQFVIFGDRTSGRPEGLKVLAQAVSDVNLLSPDLVMTVGDLVQGYNDHAQWLVQATEYKDVMKGLRMPWFPVVGNHDIYFRGKDGPPNNHEGDFETHFGPLWYAFEHKKAWFIALDSDEGDGQGKFAFDDPAAQKLSPAQFEWLKATLARAKDASSVFVFLHHPRWLRETFPGYGDDWDRVHRLLVQAGNVRAVFAGHIHHMWYAGVKDGIEYFTLGTTGAVIASDIPRAGFLHHFNVVTVRKDRIDMAAVPVGAVLDPRQITGQVTQDCAKLDKLLRARFSRPLQFGPKGEVDGVVEVEIENPVGRPIEVTCIPVSRDPRYAFSPDHDHLELDPGKKDKITFSIRRGPHGLDPWFDVPSLQIQCDYLAEGLRIALPERKVAFDLALAPASADGAPAADGQLKLDGKTGCVRVAAASLRLPDGPFTAEGWLNGRSFQGRRALLNKTESSEWGMFVSDGKPALSVFLGDKYVNAKADRALLEAGGWHHLAGVYDGSEIRLYLDGKLVARQKGAGARKPNDLPLLIGADPDQDGKPTSFFDGSIDEVRISRVARYAGDEFTPLRHFEPDADTVMLHHLDRSFGSFVLDASAGAVRGELLGGATCGP